MKKKNTFQNNIFFDDRENSFLSEKQKFSWVEESFVFEKKSGKQQASFQSGEYIGSSLSHVRVWIFFSLIAFVYSILLGRIVFLQLIDGEKYAEKAEGNRERTLPIASERGLLLDRNEVPLTKNIPSFSLALVPQDLPRSKEKKEEVVRTLSELTKKTPEEITSIIKEYGSYSYESIVIEEDIDYETALSLQIASSNLPGISIIRGSKRLYVTPFKNSGSVTSTKNALSHILGYEGKLNPEELNTLYQNGYLPSDFIGKTGIEKIYETELRGVYGKKVIEVNASGKEQSVLSEFAPKPGNHVVLSLDTQMQQKLEEIMNAYFQKSDKKKGVGIVMNPNTGEILALVSLPSFNNNDFSGGISKAIYASYANDENAPLFNRAFGGNYPAGSTIKPVMAAAALETGIITPNTSFLSTGGLRVGPWLFPDWKQGGHGSTNVRKSLAESVNTFYYYIGGGYENFTGLGIDSIQYWLTQFGFGKKTGIDLPGEVTGSVPSREKKEKTGERWYVGDTYNVSIGQGDLLVSPLQVANMTAFFANHGTLYKPFIKKAFIEAETKQKTETIPMVLASSLVKKEVIETVRFGMKDCVEQGSCRRLSTLSFSSAGKTGTAQWNREKQNHAWFTSFAPFENPEIVVTILVEEGEEGSRIAVPIAFDFYSWWGKYRQNP